MQWLAHLDADLEAGPDELTARRPVRGDVGGGRRRNELIVLVPAAAAHVALREAVRLRELGAHDRQQGDLLSDQREAAQRRDGIWRRSQQRGEVGVDSDARDGHLRRR